MMKKRVMLILFCIIFGAIFLNLVSAEFDSNAFREAGLTNSMTVKFSGPPSYGGQGIPLLSSIANLNELPSGKISDTQPNFNREACISYMANAYGFWDASVGGIPANGKRYYSYYVSSGDSANSQKMCILYSIDLVNGYAVLFVNRITGYQSQEFVTEYDTCGEVGTLPINKQNFLDNSIETTLGVNTADPTVKDAKVENVFQANPENVCGCKSEHNLGSYYFKMDGTGAMTHVLGIEKNLNIGTVIIGIGATNPLKPEGIKLVIGNDADKAGTIISASGSTRISFNGVYGSVLETMAKDPDLWKMYTLKTSDPNGRDLKIIEAVLGRVITIKSGTTYGNPNGKYSADAATGTVDILFKNTGNPYLGGRKDARKFKIVLSGKITTSFLGIPRGTYIYNEQDDSYGPFDSKQIVDFMKLFENAMNSYYASQIKNLKGVKITSHKDYKIYIGALDSAERREDVKFYEYTNKDSRWDSWGFSKKNDAWNVNVFREYRAPEMAWEKIIKCLDTAQGTTKEVKVKTDPVWMIRDGAGGYLGKAYLFSPPYVFDDYVTIRFTDSGNLAHYYSSVLDKCQYNIVKSNSTIIGFSGGNLVLKDEVNMTFPQGAVRSNTIFSVSQININSCNHCTNGIKDEDETGIDCGGICDPCEASCSDGIQNQDETGIDCGGICLSNIDEAETCGFDFNHDCLFDACPEKTCTQDRECICFLNENPLGHCFQSRCHCPLEKYELGEFSRARDSGEMSVSEIFDSARIWERV